MHRKIIFFTVIALIFALFTVALADNDIAVVVKKGGNAFQNPDLTGRKFSVKGYMVLNLMSIDGNIAKVEYNGRYAYMRMSKLMTYDSAAGTLMTVKKAAKVTSLPTSGKSKKVKKGTTVTLIARIGTNALVKTGSFVGYMNQSLLKEISDVDYEQYEAIVNKARLNVFKKPDTSSKKIATLKNGDTVTVTATSGVWARISFNGDTQGYVKKAFLAKYVLTSHEVFEDDTYTNEEKVYYFATHDMGYNCAAACGLLANIRNESNFNPGADSGVSYGICQWLGTRLDNLKSYCKDNNFDYTTLEGQCNYMLYELKKSFSAVHSTLTGTTNDAQGAYNAAYEFCCDYEKPADKTGEATKRGKLARDTYFPKYSKQK